LKSRLIYRIFLILIVLGTVLLLPRVAYDYNPAFQRITLILTIFRLGLLLVLLVEISRILNEYIIKKSIRSWIKNIATLIYGLVVVFIILEGVFMFIGRSHYAGYTLSAKIWFFRNWKPINAYGYRDDPVDTTKTFNIFALGDSYTAGHGLADYTQRYSNLLEQELISYDTGVQVINLGRNGADTQEEFTLMQSFIEASGIYPDAIVLQYFGNDIEDVARRYGLDFDGFARYSDLPPGFNEAIESSYFLNYFYWLMPHGDMEPYIDFIHKAYHDSIIFQAYLNDIKLFTDYCSRCNIPLLVLVFPFLQDLETSRTMFVDKMCQYFDQQDIPYIDVSRVVEGISVPDRTINNNDSHSSAQTNRLITDAMKPIMLKFVKRSNKSD
jgi:hypothetical protein